MACRKKPQPSVLITLKKCKKKYVDMTKVKYEMLTEILHVGFPPFFNSHHILVKQKR